MNKVNLIGFYVYMDRLSDGTIFYVGKGSGGRFYSPFRSRAWLKIAIGGHTRFIVKQGLTEQEAFKLESDLIKKHSSTVVNYSRGGRGHTHSEETRRKISLKLMGNKNGIGHKVSKVERLKIGERNRNRVCSDASRLKMSISRKGRPSPMKGRKFSKEHRRKLSIATTNYFKRIR